MRGEPGEATLEIAGVWRRLAAFVLDTLILAVLGLGIGWLFLEQVMAFGQWGRFVGFAIALVYFGLMNSRLLDGQTPGKMGMGLRVVDTAGEPIGVGRAFLRYSILGLPFYLNGIVLPSVFGTLPVAMVVSVVIFGGLFAICYLFLFNRRTRQSLHDLAVGTVVVGDHPERGHPTVLPVWRGHAVPVALIAVLALAAPLMMGRLAEREDFRALLALQRGVLQEPDVQAASVTLKTTYPVGAPRQRLLVATVRVRNQQAVNQEVATRIERRITELYPQADRPLVTVVKLNWGWDLGIVRSNRSMAYRFASD